MRPAVSREEPPANLATSAPANSSNMDPLTSKGETWSNMLGSAMICYDLLGLWSSCLFRFLQGCCIGSCQRVLDHLNSDAQAIFRCVQLGGQPASLRTVGSHGPFHHLLHVVVRHLSAASLEDQAKTLNPSGPSNIFDSLASLEDTKVTSWIQKAVRTWHVSFHLSYPHCWRSDDCASVAAFKFLKMARSPRTTASRTQWMSQKSRSKPASVKVLKAWESWACVSSILGDGAGGSREDQFGTHQQAHLYNYLYIYIYI